MFLSLRCLPKRPKMTLRRLQDRPESVQDRPRPLQDHPKTAQDDLRPQQQRPMTAQDRPKTAQERKKTSKINLSEQEREARYILGPFSDMLGALGCLFVSLCFSLLLFAAFCCFRVSLLLCNAFLLSKRPPNNPPNLPRPPAESSPDRPGPAQDRPRPPQDHPRPPKTTPRPPQDHPGPTQDHPKTTPRLTGPYEAHAHAQACNEAHAHAQWD